MGVKCEILMSNAKGVYRPGQSVDGVVKYTVTEPMEVTSVTLSMIGRGLCCWAPLISYVGTLYTGTEDFVNHCSILQQARGNETVFIQPGIYEQPFSFMLPNGIPSSYKDIRCFIAYFIQLKFGKTNTNLLSFSKKFIAEFRVQGDRKPLLQNNVTCQLAKNFLMQNKGVNFVAHIAKPIVNAGEDIVIALNINNEAEVDILAIKTEIIKYVTYKSDCDHEKKRSKVVNATEIKYDTKKDETQLIVPTTPELQSIYSNIFIKEYKVRVTLKFPFPHTEASLELPVVIVANNNDVDVDLDDQPPPYWQVMNEKKGEGLD
ncbi:uncharacterized protein LOC124629842 [Helicoverpa zea]|uniref:uncharacterized protein LOC124629842 n=1 Tax=Helicoverpa zea TaxID=7113 RepID=UPI001F59C749|nr:uncharacterized protein LOC124629842 [Helicoverpa zea]